MIGFYLTGVSVGICSGTILFVALRIISSVREVSDDI